MVLRRLLTDIVRSVTNTPLHILVPYLAIIRPLIKMPVNPLPQAPAPQSPLARYRLLSPTAAVRVSPLCLGGMGFGDAWKDYSETSHRGVYKANNQKPLTLS